MRIVAVASVVLVLVADSSLRPACAEGAGQRPAANPVASAAAKPPRPAKLASTPETRSAAALALSSEPVFDEGTYQRIKETLLSYAAIQVRGGWPSLPADAKLAPGVSGPDVAVLRRAWS